MPLDAIGMMVQLFSTCRLDYCNSLFHGISDGLMTQLQSAQNAAARLVSGARRYHHIPPVLHQFHWLPVRKHVDFKISTLVYRLLSGTVPSYLATDCQLVCDEGRRRLHSTNSRTCVIRWTYSQFGDRCFAAEGPKLWSSILVQLRQADLSYKQFK